MDRSLSDDKIRSILDQFTIWAPPAGVAGGSFGSARRIVSFFKNAGQNLPANSSGQGQGVSVINSHRFTQYVPGKTGGDGVHYNRESGEAWARRVINEYDEMFPKIGRKVAATE